MLSAGRSQAGIARELAVPRSTVGLWARRAREEGGLSAADAAADNVVEFVRMPELETAHPTFGTEAESEPAPSETDFLSGFLDTYAGGPEVPDDGFGFDDLPPETRSAKAPGVLADSVRVLEAARTVLSVELSDPFPDEAARSLLEAAVRKSVAASLRRCGEAEIDAVLLREAAGLHAAFVALCGDETDRWPGGVCVLRTATAVFRFSS